jgi:3-phenylpropionate/trans-cinnamate dioxygenase ferredoxin reductase subunit
MSGRTFIIVGASLAGAEAAEELRARGFDGRVVLVGSEPARPYERPPLTKDYLRGESEREKAYVHDDGFTLSTRSSSWRTRRRPRSTPARRE